MIHGGICQANVSPQESSQYQFYFATFIILICVALFIHAVWDELGRTYVEGPEGGV